METLKFKVTNEQIGEWIDSGYEIDLSEIMYCSICKYSELDYLTTEICPQCGAKMKGADDETD